MIHVLATALEFLWRHAGPILYFSCLFVLACVFLRAFVRVKGDSPTLEQVAGSAWFFSLRTFRIAMLLAAIVLACTCVNLADHTLRDLVAKDAAETIQDVRERTARRLH